MKENFETKFRVAELLEHPGYKAVIHDLLDHVEALSIRMEQSQTHELDISLLAEWKASRKIVKRLTSFPEKFAEEIAEQHAEMQRNG